MQGKKDQKKEEKILHAWNELSTQDWTTLRFVLGNIWGLTLAKVLVKKFFLKFIHPNRHTHHGVCFSLLPHLKPYPSTKNFYIKVHIKLFCFRTQSLLNIYKSLYNDSTGWKDQALELSYILFTDNITSIMEFPPWL